MNQAVFVGNAKGAVKLVSAHALLGRTKQMSSQHTLAQDDLAALQYRPHSDSILLAAVATEIQTGTVALAFQRALKGPRASE